MAGGIFCTYWRARSFEFMGYALESGQLTKKREAFRSITGFVQWSFRAFDRLFGFPEMNCSALAFGKRDSFLAGREKEPLSTTIALDVDAPPRFAVVHREGDFHNLWFLMMVRKREEVGENVHLADPLKGSLVLPSARSFRSGENSLTPE
jgi:hypothetical protein